jgi:hypothetical protein
VSPLAVEGGAAFFGGGFIIEAFAEPVEALFKLVGGHEVGLVIDIEECA